METLVRNKVWEEQRHESKGKKYPKVPASIAKGNVQFFIKRTSILDLLF